jgi:1-phosphofructokinase
VASRPTLGSTVTTGDVMVFAPSPLLTATIEQQHDQNDLHLHAGGQGVWQARMVALLGSRAVFCTVLGGETGRVLDALLHDEAFEVRAVRRATGVGWYVHDRRAGHRDEVARGIGTPLDRHDVDELYNIALAEGLRAPVSVLGGPAHPSLLKPDVYRRLATDLTANGSRVLADLAGDCLKAALAGGLALVRVSHEEVLDAGLAADEGLAALCGAARRLRDEGAAQVIISRAHEPALALLDDALMLVEAPAVQAVEHRGAGDSMMAGIAAKLAQGADLLTAVRVGAAAGAVNVTRHGLGTGHADTIAELATRVKLSPLA